MTALLPNVDPDGLLEFSVVYTDRSLNHMSKKFQQVMREMNRILKLVYHAEGVVLVPGGGTYGMEAVARQFATGKKALVIRDGFFSFRWTQIFDMGAIPYVGAGADVMRPGIRSCDDGILAGDVVAVVDEKFGRPLAVGEALLASEELRAAAKGRMVHTLHYAGDKLWGAEY